MADANFNPKAKLEIDTSSAVNQLKTLVDLVKDLKQSIDAQNKVNVDTKSFNEKIKVAKEGVNDLDETVSVFSKSASAATKAVGQELDNLKNKANQKITFGSLTTALDKLANKIDTIVTKNIESLKQSMKEVGKESQHMATRMNNQHLSRKFGELKRTIEGVVDDIKTLSSQHIDVKTEHSKAEFEQLKQQLQQIYNESQQLRNATIDVKDDQARQQLTNLIRLVQKFRQEVEAISNKTINVKITNRGFDKVLQSALRYFTLIDKTNKNILQTTSKQEKNAKKITDETARTNKGLERAAKHYANMVLNSNKVAKSSSNTTTQTQKLGGILLKGFYSMRGIAAVFQEVQGFAYQISQYITGIGRTLVSTVVPAFKSMVADAFQMASQLETSKIGFKLFFPNDNPDELTQEIKRRAVASTAFDSGQMAKYASQFATLTNGNSTLALDAIEGIADLLMASGQEVSTYLEKVVTNTIQVVSYGKATARDWREFTQKIPIFERILKSIQPELAERMKDENAEITKEDTKYLLEAFQIVHNNSPISGVSAEYAKSFSGLKQVMKESITSTVDEIIEQSGFFGEVKRWLQQSSLMADMLNKYLTPVAQKLTTFMSQFTPEDLGGIISDIVDVIKNLVKDIASDWGLEMKNITPQKVRATIKKIAQFIADFVRGWAKGIKQLLDFVQSIMQKFGINPSQVALVVGFLASPWGNMISRLLTALAGFGQLIANVANAFKGTKLASLLSSFTGKIGTFLNPQTLIAKIKASGAMTTIASKIGMAIQGVIQGAMLMAVGAVGNDLVYGITGNTHLGAAIEIAGGAGGGALAGASIGSAIAPGIGTAIGAALGGLIGGIVSAINAGNKTRERIEQQMNELQSKLKTEYDKILDEYIPKIANDVKGMVNAQLKKKGIAEIDWKSDAGAYASTQIQKYMRETDPSKWNTEDMMKIAYEAYNYQKLRKELDQFTETEDFRKKTGGGAFDYEHDLNRRNALAEVIKAAKLLGPNYDYGDAATFNAEGLVRDYLNGGQLTNDQVTAIIEKYRSLEQGNKSLEEQFAENISEWNTSLIAANEHNANLVSLLGATNTDLVNLKDAIGELKGTIDGKEYTLNLDGELKQNSNKGKQWNPQNNGMINTNPLNAGLGGITLSGGLKPINKFLGGPLKPVYKAHGGPLGVDTVPVMAQRGEFIVRKNVADKVGLPALTALNLGDTKLAAALMGRPNNTVDSSYNRNWNTSNTDNRKVIRNIVKIINKNTASRLNSGYALANRLALG